MQIDSFEIGNEYYAYPDMTAEEYASVANELVIAVDDAIQEYVGEGELPDDWTAPKIAIQAGAGWLSGDNQTIIDGLSEDALGSITSVINHFYSSDLNAVGMRDKHLGQISDWEDATGLNQTGFTGEHKAWKVSHDQRKFREPFFDRSAGACSAFGA